ncbi:metallophosphoesterase [Halocynthiibacter sp. C4]|uniref:metallophosphoesterase n=1 Tax=Halocynthiibacter sp. C4 TaxID=2992758 RepID=UPI00237BCB26|nr:metallophosphoesterase [Halocynthiibacter sp. C4]MDE0588579.1 metallophosphoesterase [Halocynthiibacter sp. C4]
MRYDIIPDIHGQADKLKFALDQLGYRQRGATWKHSDPSRMCVFLGDFIDRGPSNKEVISIVRDMMEAGRAVAVMGNHELNAIHFHTRDPENGKYLRARSDKNTKQHQSFLKEFPIGEVNTHSALEWMKTLPLYLELDGFRAVHACWSDGKIASLNACTQNGVLSEEQFIEAGRKDSELFPLVDITTKGPEIDLPEGYAFTDKNGAVRTKVRAKWWAKGNKNWGDIAISVPDLEALPKSEVPVGTPIEFYCEAATPVFFGHYWLDGDPTRQAHNALCLDYSAGTTGPLATYLFESGEENLQLSRIKLFSR